MAFAPTLEPHFHQEFQLAPNTDTWGCCGCFRSKPKEYLVNEQYELEGRKKCLYDGRNRNLYEKRIESNQRLCELIKLKLGSDPIVANNAFELLKTRIDLSNGDPITSEKLSKVISAIYELRSELSADSIRSEDKSKTKEQAEVVGKKKRRRKAKKVKTKLSQKI